MRGFDTVASVGAANTMGNVRLLSAFDGHGGYADAIVDRLATRGEKGCCISLPKAWHAGMKLLLDVEESDRTIIYPKQSRELEIPP